MARQGDGRAHLPRLQRRALRATRLLFTIDGKTIHDVGQLNFDELHAFLGTVKPTGPRRRRRPAGAEGDPRPARAAARHRPRLSELQPPLGHALGRRVAAHPAVDADRLRADGHALRARRAEHRPAPEGQRQDDRDAREPARHRQHGDRRRARRGHDPRRRSHRRDGPGPGRARRHGRRAGHARRRAAVQGVADRAVPLGQAVDRDAGAAAQGQRQGARRPRRAREQPQVDRRRRFPLGMLVAITGASGSGKSTLVNEILYKALWKRLVDTRTLPGEHDGVDGIEHVHKVVNIDQSPIGRNSRSNPGDLHRLLRHHPRPVHAGAAVGRARLQAGPLQLQRQGRPLRGVPGRRRRSPRSSTSCPTSR